MHIKHMLKVVINQTAASKQNQILSTYCNHS